LHSDGGSELRRCSSGDVRIAKDGRRRHVGQKKMRDTQEPRESGVLDSKLRPF
jgi:hypothetical protein